MKQRILDAIDLRTALNAISVDYTKQSKDNLLCHCPFHEDSKESFSISTDKNKNFVYKCFGCNETGDIFDLIMKIKGIDFKESLQFLSSLCNVEIKKTTTKKQKKKRGKLVKTYVYFDLNGEPLIRVLRFEPKDFSQQHYDKKSKRWISSIPEDFKRIPYKIRGLLKNTKYENDGIHKIYCIVEGEKDADNLIALKIPATTNIGGSSNYTKDFIDALPKNATAIIIQDNDRPGRIHARKLASDLIKSGRICKLLELPEMPRKGDISDYIEKHKSTKEDLLRLFQTAIDVEEENENKNENENSEEKIKDNKDNKEKRDKPNQYILAKDFLSNEEIIYTRNDLYIFKNGCYRNDSVEATIRKFVIEETLTDSKKSLGDEVVYTIKTLNKVDDAKVNATKLINCKNGLLDIESQMLIEHDPSYLITRQLPVTFDKNAYSEDCDYFLDEIFIDGPTRQLFEEYLGYSLLNDNRFEKIMLLTGTGSNGKSILMYLINEMFGSENTSSIDNFNLTNNEDKFSAAGMLDKYINICHDISGSVLEDTGRLKAIASGNEVEIQRKYQQPFKVKLTTKMIFSTNKLPRTKDISHGFYRRFLIVDMPFSFLTNEEIKENGGKLFEGEKKADVRLQQKLSTEEVKSYMLRLALNGLKRLLEQNDFSTPQHVIDAKKQYRLENDSVASFLDDRVVEEYSEWISVKDIYEEYKSYCDEDGLKSVSKSVMIKRISNVIRSATKKRKQEASSKRRFDVILNVRWRNERDLEPQLKIIKANENEKRDNAVNDDIPF